MGLFWYIHVSLWHICLTFIKYFVEVQHTATHCNTLQHTATHCNTPTSIRRFFKHSISFRRIWTSSLTAKWSTFSTKCSCHLCDCDMTLSYVTRLIHQGRDSFIKWFFFPTKCSCHLCDYDMSPSYVTWLIFFQMKGSCHVWNCDMTLSYLTQLIHKRLKSFMWLYSSSTSETNNINLAHCLWRHSFRELLTLQRVAACCCSVLQRVAASCSVLQRVAVYCSALQCVSIVSSVLQCVAVCCSVSQRVAVCCSVSQRVAVCCSVLHVLQYVPSAYYSCDCPFGKKSRAEEIVHTQLRLPECFGPNHTSSLFSVV